MAYLILVRHGESEWNALGLWTGWKDVNLTDKGRAQARQTGEELKDLKIDYVFTSPLKRAKQTYEEIAKTLNLAISSQETQAIIERNYGDYTGKNKWEVKKTMSEEDFQKLRRSWDFPPKNGESLKMVNQRAVKFYQSTVLPLLKENKNVMLVGHGNTHRALIKDLENLTEEEIAKLEFGIGEAYIYTIDSDGKVTNKQIRAKNPLAGVQ